MSRLIALEPNRTYATEANAVKAVEKRYPADQGPLTYFIQKTADNRYFPVFVGERAIQVMAHFHFNVVM